MTTPIAPAQQLLEGAKAGDEAAWSRIVTDLGPKIRGYARARGVADPEDLTQDVFVAAASRIGDFDGDDRAFRSWLFGIAYRQIVNRYRASAKQTAPLPERLADPTRSPEDTVVGRFEAGEAVAALDVLSDVERDVVLMRVVAELDTRDVAAAVGKRPGNVRVIQSRAMAKLRDELGRRGYGTVGVWTVALAAAVGGPINVARASVVAGAAATAAGTGTVAAAGTGTVAAAGVVAGASTVAKVTAAVALAATVGGGTAAVTGNLPDPAQRWIADVADTIGVTLPRPTHATDLELPDAPVPGVLDPIPDPMPVPDPGTSLPGTIDPTFPGSELPPVATTLPLPDPDVTSTSLPEVEPTIPGTIDTTLPDPGPPPVATTFPLP